MSIEPSTRAVHPDERLEVRAGIEHGGCIMAFKDWFIVGRKASKGTPLAAAASSAKVCS